jgi:D-beta-D-heptose 7-phosphate kinase/D-beta-D-heptose 1-phosphate adenosyltransferase
MIAPLHEAIRLIEQDWSTRRILVLGDVMLDRSIWGEVGRISPEAPVPVVRALRQTAQPGGAANVAMNLANLGAQTMVAGFIGEDEDGRLLNEMLKQNRIEPLFVTSAGFPTTAKLRILGGRQQMLRLDSERIEERCGFDYDCLMDLLYEQLPGCHALVLSDYAKGALTAAVCRRAIDAARRQGIPVLVDPKCADFSRFRGATTICPNLAELAAALGSHPHPLEPLLAAAQGLARSLDVDFLTATLSEKGIALLRAESRLLAPATARQVFDVSGAGDTVIAVLALCLASGLQPEAAIELANVAAGIVVGKVGTVAVECHELLDALSPQIALHGEDKVLSRAQLASRAALWRAHGERVVFTNGCFDLLHIGHISLLEQARRMGDRLVVAINSDASVSALKGAERPVVGEQERARVLAALAAVDAVVVFPQATPLELILALRPDVLVKGGDYELDAVVGAHEAATWGGQVRIVPTVAGFSTTRLLEASAMRRAAPTARPVPLARL